MRPPPVALPNYHALAPASSGRPRTGWLSSCSRCPAPLGACLGRPATLSDALDAPLEHCFEARGVRDPKQERERKRDYEIFERDGWRCAVPGCTSYRNLHAHHEPFRSHRGDDAPESLITLCAWHHQRALREDRVVRVIGRARTRFAIGVRRGRPPLAVYASGDVLL